MISGSSNCKDLGATGVAFDMVAALVVNNTEWPNGGQIPLALRGKAFRLSLWKASLVFLVVHSFVLFPRPTLV